MSKLFFDDHVGNTRRHDLEIWKYKIKGRRQNKSPREEKPKQNGIM